jgi:Transposase DDE domain
VFAPVPKPRNGDTRDPHVARDGDRAAVAAWRERMGTDGAKQIYKQRAATAEPVHADAKPHRGLARLPLRGLDNALGAATLFALTYTILRAIALHG